MTSFHPLLVGIHPRSERLIKTFRAYSRKKIGFDELSKVLERESREIIKLQLDLNYRYVIDGMLRWHDLLRPLAEKLDGVEVDGLSRWFDNNLFYKKPMIVGEVKRTNKILKEYVYPSEVPDRRFKLVLPDPFTFTSLSELGKRRFDDVLFDVSKAMNEEIREMEVEMGLGQVQLSAPSLVWRKLDEDSLELAKDAVDECLKGVSAEKMIHLPFGDALNSFPQILDARVDVIGFDMTSTKLKELREYRIDRGVGLGFVDGRNSLIEDVEFVRRMVEDYLEVNEPEMIYITPSCDLEYLPRSVADEKVRLLKKIVDELEEVE
ncbi:MAG: hypothetical protein DRN60_02460 [Thaumarchaeota archaeon]|nr:MAG: hypothetical protein DRN60_02460 [Nitrososphaerota archaeon]